MFNDLVTGHYLTILSQINRLQRVAQKLLNIPNMFIQVYTMMHGQKTIKLRSFKFTDTIISLTSTVFIVTSVYLS
jgi:hypothetical protein